MAARESNGPRVRVAALILDAGRLVLVRHRAGSATYHLLPGGGVGYRETVADALVREVREETGLDIEVDRPLLISDTIDPHGPRHIINLTFLAHRTGGSITRTPEDPRVEAVDLVEPERLVELDLRPPIARELTEIVARNVDAAPARYLGSLFTEGS